MSPHSGIQLTCANYIWAAAMIIVCRDMAGAQSGLWSCYWWYPKRLVQPLRILLKQKQTIPPYYQLSVLVLVIHLLKLCLTHTYAAYEHCIDAPLHFFMSQHLENSPPLTLPSFVFFSITHKTETEGLLGCSITDYFSCDISPCS